MSADLYVPPKHVDRLEDCVFYHTMQIPGYGLVEGQWDLRETADAYLGHLDFSGKRVLELGKASGYLTFYMEEKGAEVVAYDLSEHDDWDVVPMARLTRSQSELHPLYPPGVRHWTDFLRIRREGIGRLNDGFWLAHRAYGSRARLVTGTAYEVPSQIGAVDVVVFGSILLHLRDPFLALQRSLRLARSTVVVTDLVPDVGRHVSNGAERGSNVLASGAHATFVPDASLGGPLDIWWHLSPELVVRMLAVLGFEESTVDVSSHQFRSTPVPLYTVVGRRTVPMEPLE